MEFRALGPLEVVDGGASLELGPPKHRTLLAFLLVHVNEVVAADRITDALWPDEPDTKSNALWVYVSRLRSALEPRRSGRGSSGVLVTRGSGYMLALDEATYDVLRFERLAREGRGLLESEPGRAAELLGDALALWRGDAFGDVRYDEFAQATIARLEEARVAAKEDRVDAELACGRAHAIVGDLEVLRAEHPTRERPVGQLMLALYRLGRPADALRALSRYRRELDEQLGISPSPWLARLEEQILLHDPRLAGPDIHDATAVGDAAPTNPYRGLRPFLEGDAAEFFGREDLVADLVGMLGAGRRLVALVGASGSGKSSAVRAGLIPALQVGAVPGSEDWHILTMVPGASPTAEAEAALGTPLSTAGAADGSTTLLVIDQFEELFTLADPRESDRFLDALVAALDAESTTLIVVAVLRADFYGLPLQHPGVGAHLTGGIVNVTPMTDEQLERAALEPAQRAGVAFEPALLQTLLADVRGEPGALPQFQYALTDLFERRSGRVLTNAAYRAMGGVSGALSRRADGVFESFTPPEQDAARQLFLRLVAVTESGETVRRRVDGTELLALEVDVVALQSTLDAFGGHRLLAFDADRLTGAPTVEVAHEALLAEWPRLQVWVAEAADDLHRRAALSAAMQEWELAGRNTDYLLTGDRLAEYVRWRESSSIRLTAPENAFLDAGLEAHAARQHAETERQRRESAISRRARRRLWTSVAAGVTLATAAAAALLTTWGDDPVVGVAVYGGVNPVGESTLAGVERAALEHDVELLEVRALVDPDAQFRALAEESDFVLIGTFIAPWQDIIADHPDVRFGLLEGHVDRPNVASVSFANQEGGYLAGITAALTTRTGVVGFVGGEREPLIEEFCAGYEAGVRSVDAQIEVLSTYVEEPIYPDLWLLNAYSREDLGRQRAADLYARGADVVFHAAGVAGFGVFDAAVDASSGEQHRWAIGIDNDQWFEVEPRQREHLLTSVVKRLDAASYLLTDRFLDGSFAKGQHELGLADGAFDYTRHEPLDDAVAAQLDRAKNDIASGRVVVPSVPAGEPLDLDPLPAGFDRIAALASEQVFRYVEWLVATRQGELDAACTNSGTRRGCAELLLEHVGEWLATI